MPPPAGRLIVTALDVGPGAPFVSQELPDDGGKPTAEDLRILAAQNFANQNYQRESYRDEHQVTSELVPPAFLIESTTSGTFVDSSVFLVPVADCKVDEDLLVTFSTTASYAGATTEFGDVRLVVVEDFGGANSAVVVPGARVAVGGQDRYLPTALSARHRVATAGPARVKLQLRSLDGTSALSLLLSAQFNVTRIRRVTPEVTP